LKMASWHTQRLTMLTLNEEKSQYSIFSKHLPRQEFHNSALFFFFLFTYFRFSDGKIASKPTKIGLV
jgi:hypothetical protein